MSNNVLSDVREMENAIEKTPKVKDETNQQWRIRIVNALAEDPSGQTRSVKQLKPEPLGVLSRKPLKALTEQPKTLAITW